MHVNFRNPWVPMTKTLQRFAFTKAWTDQCLYIIKKELQHLIVSLKEH